MITAEVTKVKMSLKVILVVIEALGVIIEEAEIRRKINKRHLTTSPTTFSEHKKGK